VTTEAPPDPTTPDTWRRVDELFHAALDLQREADREAVEAFLDRSCEGDDKLRSQVAKLLDAHARAGTFLQGSPTPQLAELLAGDEDGEASAVGRQIGAYRLIEQIGRGGMGAVYLAERADDEYRKQVAIKLIGRGTDSGAVIRHFRNERQILASLEHPNIARLLDGGTADDGTPYFVMEHIEGQPIDDYCDEHALPVAARLELFLQVGSAVAYAHQRLVVHRDIKPSNILVGPDGTPKLLDFGIAKILDPEVGGETTATGTLALMTPAYASPEQVMAQPVTTLTDVYSLGVLLYELLTGRPPYELHGRPPHQIAHVICNAEPERPSSFGQRRLRGDLDNIALLALRKDPARRYRSVEHLCSDIRKHLAGLPVSARKETFAYRAAKFVRRHRAGVAAALLLLVTLVGGIVATGWQAHRARVQEDIAREAQARAERRFADVRQLARTVLFDYHDAIKDLAGATPVRHRLVADALKYLDALSREEHTDPGLLREMAAAYERVGDVQGGDFSANLGDTTGALRSYRKALELREALLAAHPESATARREAALSHDKLGMMLEGTGDVTGAAAQMRAAMALLEPLVARPSPSSGSAEEEELRFQLAGLHDRTGMLALNTGEVARAIDQHRRALAILAAMTPAQRKTPGARKALATFNDHLGSALIETGDLERALAHTRAALALRAGLVAESPLSATYKNNLGVTYYNEGDVLGRMGRDREALEAYRKSAAIGEELLAADPESESSPAFAILRIGDTLFRLADYRQALTSYRRAHAMHAASLKADPANLWNRAAVVIGYAKIGRTLARLGQAEDALAACAEAIALLERTPVEPDNIVVGGTFAESYTELGDAYATLAADERAPKSERQARWRSARDAHRRSFEFWRDLRDRGLLSAVDAGRPDAAAREVARSEQALSR
jgi:eukaryotic-like serine/threonine-protein kinase